MRYALLLLIEKDQVLVFTHISRELAASRGPAKNDSTRFAVWHIVGHHKAGKKLEVYT
jgi:hypothetical protein